MALTTKPLRPGLVLGPVPYLWDPVTWRDFYHRIADEADVDTVVVGETVCSKRLHFFDAPLDGVVDRLLTAGKSVRLATLGLVTLDRELRAGTRLAARGLPIEVSELSVHALLAGRTHTIGPLVNVYNAPTARVLWKGGATSICLPPELPLTAVGAIASAVSEVAFEVHAFGRVPLAISARCAHARVKGQTKDNCRFVCGDDPDGLVVDTLDGQRFLALNGVQTMSGTVQCLLGDVPAVLGAGVSALRLSPQVCDMVAIADLFRSVADGRLDPADAMATARTLYPVDYSNGFIYAQPGHVLHEARMT